MGYILPLQKLVEQFCKLKGVGSKTAARYAFSVLDMDEKEVNEFASCLIEAKTKIRFCEKCGNLTDKPICDVCSDPTRNKSVICVVENSKTIMSIERVKEYDGLYHVLGGAISPMDGIGPDDLRINELLDRIKSGEVKELIIATNPNISGETTAMYISKLVAPFGIKTTRLAYGVPVGSELEYADEVTLMRALMGRSEI